ncbi:MAG: serine hydrolase domain-containing protein [Bryobacteraceae bacterium]|nr:serine hydrolase domain-containing protein [Bryobacteraceae bacterium]
MPARKALRTAVLLLAALPAFAADAPLDRFMREVMRRFDLPGGQIALARDGRFVFSRAYGFADTRRRIRVRSSSLFRIGSVSKTVTQVAILTLVDAGKLRLSDRAFVLLDHLKPPPGASPDPRLHDITVLHLLQHQAGWDSIEPMFPPWSRKAAAALNVPEPPECETIVRFMRGRPLDYTPGTRTSYSNFGYCVLGRIVEHVSGVSYEEYVKNNVLRPAGIGSMRIGGTRLRERAPREVLYYHQLNQTELPYMTESVFPGEGMTPWAYGGYYLRATDAHGGWIGSAEDIARFGLAIDGRWGPPLLSSAGRHVLMNLPRKQGEEYPLDTPFHVSHAGALQGSNSALLYRTREGLSVGITFNSLPVDYRGFFAALMEGLDAALASVHAVSSARR